jgi:hypothetical protein
MLMLSVELTGVSASKLMSVTGPGKYISIRISIVCPRLAVAGPLTLNDALYDDC